MQDEPEGDVMLRIDQQGDDQFPEASPADGPFSLCNGCKSVAEPVSDRRFHNVSSVSVEKSDDFVRFPVSNPMISESAPGVVQANFPLALSNVQAGVRSLHVSTRVVAGSTCQMANLIDKQLPATLLRIDATRCKATEFRIASEHLVRVIHERGDDIITAEPLIERRVGCTHCHQPPFRFIERQDRIVVA